MIVELRPPAEADLPFYSEMLNDAPLQRMVMGPPISRSPDEVRQWLDQKLQSKDTKIFSIDSNGGFAGYVQIANIDWDNGVGTLGICLMANSRGAGVGTEAVSQLHEFARELGLRKLILTVRADNLRGISIYDKLGYRHVGAWTKQLRSENGNYLDVVIMEYFLRMS